MSTVEKGKPTPVARYEAVVEDHLARARSRIRLLDTTAALLGFLIGTFAYALGMALLDSWLKLPSLARQAAFAVYSLLALVYLGLFLVRLLGRRINPYYAARQVEQALPGAKNSLVNWLDLRHEKLPSAIRGAVSHRAARDIARADLDQVISVRRTAWLGAIVGALFLALVVLFLRSGPFQFVSLIKHAFTPFVETPIATRTVIHLVQPEGGDVTVPVGQAVSFTAQVEGKIPDPRNADALKVLYRYRQDEPYQEQPLERGDGSQWTAMVPAFQVHNGFWYKITGGDAETPEYRVQVRSIPLLTSFDVTYHFRPYLYMADQTTQDPNLEGLRGTAVTLLAHTNRRVKEGHLQIADDKRDFAAERVPEDPQALRFHLVLEKNATYRIWFTAEEGDHNNDPMPYTIKVLADSPPRVTLTQPGQDIHLPANGILRLRGAANDDFGITRLVLQKKLNGQEALPPQPYQNKKSLQQADGSYPQHLDYMDFVDLSKVTTRTGEPLHMGMVLEYWLEAADNCDFPEPNVAQSAVFKVLLDDPQDARQQAQERHQAEEEEKQQQQNQDQGSGQSPQQDHAQGRNQPQPGQEGNHQAQQGADNHPQGGGQSSQAKPQEGSNQGKDNNDLDKKLQQVEQALKNQDQKNNSGKGQSQDTKGENQGTEKNQQTQEGTQSKNEGSQAPSGGTSRENNQGQQGKQPQGNPNQGGSQQGNSQQNKEGSQGKNEGGQPQTGAASKENNQGQKEKTGSEAQGNPNQGGTPSQGNNQQTKEGTQNKKEGSQSQPGGTSKENSQGQQGQKEKTREPNNPPPSGGSEKTTGGQSQEGTEKNQGGQKEAQGDHSSTGQKNTNSGSPSGPANPQAGQPSGEQNPDKTGTGDRTKGQPNPAGAGQENQGQQPHPNSDAHQGTNGSEKNSSNGSPQEGSAKPSGNQAKGENQPNQGDTTGSGQHSNGSPESRDHGSSGTKENPAAGQGSSPEKKGENSSGQANGQKTSGQEVKDLAQQLQSNDSQARAEARQKLNDLAQNAKDPKTRQAAADALKEAGSQGQGQESSSHPPGQGQEPKSDQVQDLARKLQSNDGGERAEAARKLNDLAHNAGDPKTQQAAADALKKQNQGQGENPEVKDLAQKLQSQDPGERAEAAKKLNDLAQNAGDPKTQQAAADALKKAADAQNQSEQGSQEGTNSTPGRNNPAEQTNTKGQAQGSEKSNPPSSPEKTANHSPGQPGKGSSNQGQSPQPVEGKNSSSNNPGHNQETGSQTSPNKSAQDNPMKEKTDQVGNGPGQGLRGNREHPIPGGGPGRQAAAGTGPDATFQKKAGNLQIEELDKKLTPDMLRKLNWTEEEKQEFLQGLRRKAAAEAAQQPEKLADPRRPGGPLGNLGPHSVQSGQGQEDNVRYTGPALPPPGFREAQKEFTQNLSKQEKSGP